MYYNLWYLRMRNIPLSTFFSFVSVARVGAVKLFRGEYMKYRAALVLHFRNDPLGKLFQCLDFHLGNSLTDMPDNFLTDLVCASMAFNDLYRDFAVRFFFCAYKHG